jgi:DNA-directed RNA polymerase subunit RPC12/RpoP
MKYFWCSRCAKPLPKTHREKRVGTKGWVCPTCGTGLPRHPIEIISETPELEEILVE